MKINPKEEDWDNWPHLSDFDLVLRLVDFGGLRPVLARLLGWTCARGRTPFDPVWMFLLVSWQLVNEWKRADLLRNLKNPRNADYRQRFGFQEKDPTEGGGRYFLTTIGLNAVANDEVVTIANRMQSHGVTGKIHVIQAIYDR